MICKDERTISQLGSTVHASLIKRMPLHTAQQCGDEASVGITTLELFLPVPLARKWIWSDALSSELTYGFPAPQLL